MRSALVVCASFVLGGCAPGREDASTGRERASRALVRVDVQYQRASQGEATLDAQAYFVRYRGLDESQVPTLLGLFSPRPPGVERCVSVDDRAQLDRALASRAATAEVELLDAGHLELKAGDVGLPLDARHYPELVPGVVGTVYGATGTLPATRVLGATHTLSTDGAGEFGPFSVAATLPNAFPDGSIERTTLGLKLRWTPTGEKIIDVELRPNGRRSSRAVHCQLNDAAGTYVVPNSILAALGASLADLQVTLRSRHKTLFDIPQLGQGELNLELHETLRVGAAE